MEISSLSQLFTTTTIAEKPSSQPGYPIQDSIQDGETYVYYGTRICGKVTASVHALGAFLTRIYNQEKKRQFDDKSIQDELISRRRSEIDNLRQKNDRERAMVEQLEAGIEDDKRKIADVREQLEDAKARNGEVNKMTNVKMIIGCVILTILTVYLFIFYSSTFYSAFFRNFSDGIGIGDAMFYANSIPDSLAAGFGQLIFITTAPIIFMALGYSLHYFSVQNTWTKYVKMGSIIVITFVFDCILAYLIAEKIYYIEIITKPGIFPDYSVEMAIGDFNVWAVIFCGFIVYMIWGVVFDMTITAYGELRSNEKEIKILNASIESLNSSIAEKKNSIIDCKGRITANEHKIDSLTELLSSSKQFNPQIIKTALNDFFAGWMSMMNGLSRPSSEQEMARQVFDTSMSNLFNE